MFNYNIEDFPIQYIYEYLNERIIIMFLGVCMRGTVQLLIESR